jgi:hypothetical protein
VVASAIKKIKWEDGSMNLNTLRASVVAGLLLLGASLPSQATPITWNLTGVTFEDGTMASGSIVFDAASNSSSSFNVATTAGFLPAYTYTDGNSGLYPGGGFGANNFILFTNVGDRYFNFSLSSALTDAGGTVALIATESYECFNCNPFRLVVAGALTAQAAPINDVPEPIPLALIVPAVGLLGFMTRRRNNATQ